MSSDYQQEQREQRRREWLAGLKVGDEVAFTG